MFKKIRLRYAPALAAIIAVVAMACSSSPAPVPAAPQEPAPAAPAAAPQAPAQSAPAMPAPAAPAPPQSSAPAPTAAPAAAPAPGAAMTAPAPAAPPAAPALPPPSAAQAAPAPAAPAAPPSHPGTQPPTSAQPPLTTFRGQDRSGSVNAAEDSVSTFSLDTDRTSYALALNWARSGYEVPSDSVRAEEWINAFAYGYERPARDDSFAIHTDVIQHPLNAGMLMARIAFQAPEPEYDRKPLNVTLVLDASGSMSDGNRVDIARAAAESIRGSLRSDDRIAVVHFTDGVIHDLTVEHARPNDRNVRRSIDRLQPHAATNVQAGLDLGVELAHRVRYERPDAYNYIVLMSDGVANVDATNPFAILDSAGDYDASNPLRLITIGVGIANYNDYLLEQLAQHGNGWYRYLNDAEQARATFSRDNWLALSQPFADQTRAQVTWDPDLIETWRIVGYENRVTADENFAQARKEFAEIPAGAATTVFYELDLVDEGVWLRENMKLGDVEARWVTPDSGDSNRQHAPILARYAGSLSGQDYALMRLGALVALSSDRYASPPHADGGLPRYSVQNDLITMLRDLRGLEPRLGNLTAYRDFAFLLEHMAQSAHASAGGSGSGYSR